MIRNKVTIRLFAILIAVIAFPSELMSVQVANEPEPPSQTSPDSLNKLDKLLNLLVEEQQIVGGEILVIQDGKKRLHKGYGWRDRESSVEMEAGGVFCVRSMTKPLISTSILMLIQDGKLKLDDKIAKHLPSFDEEGFREITVEHLLTHTSGLPLSLLLGKNLKELESIQAVADLGPADELLSRPGRRFNYSDQGTDTLTALIEVVSGVAAEEFIQNRILSPLGMNDSTCVMTEGHSLRQRAVSSYGGSVGAWTKFWDPSQPKIFPFFLGSQGLYSTTEDYAKFMNFWRNGGRVGNQQLLDASLVERALTPCPRSRRGDSGLPDCQARYGYLMQLWMSSKKEDQAEVVAFGHSGSDGTHAWVFPEKNAIVMYFTQSRGNRTGVRVEAALGEVFYGVPFDLEKPQAPPMDEFLGYYWEGEGDLYRAIIRDGDDMALEILGKAIVALDYVGDDKWCFRQDPKRVIEFDRSEDGKVAGYHIGDHQEFRVEVSPDLPSGKELASLVAEAHQMSLLETSGPIRLSGTIEIKRLKQSGSFESIYQWPNRFRVKEEVAGQSEQLAFDGEKTWHRVGKKDPKQLSGARAEQEQSATPMVRFGNGFEMYPHFQVIQKVEGPDGEVFVVRAGDTSATAATLYVDAKHYLVIREDSVMHVDMLGRIGRRSTFSDFQDVAGMQLPFSTEIAIAHPLVGRIVVESTIVESATDVELSDGVFQLKDE